MVLQVADAAASRAFDDARRRAEAEEAACSMPWQETRRRRRDEARKEGRRKEGGVARSAPGEGILREEGCGVGAVGSQGAEEAVSAESGRGLEWQ